MPNPVQRLFKRHRTLNTILLFSCWLLSIYLIKQILTGPRGYFAVKCQKQTIKKLENDIHKLESRNNILEKEVLFSRTDIYLETIARRELGFAKPDERLIIWIGENAPSDHRTSRSQKHSDWCSKAWNRCFYRKMQSRYRNNLDIYDVFENRKKQFFPPADANALWYKCIFSPCSLYW